MRQTQAGSPHGDPSSTGNITPRLLPGGDIHRHGWCTMCGVHYDAPDLPGCEHAGDRPVDPGTGELLPAQHPEMAAWLGRAAQLRYIPSDSQ